MERFFICIALFALMVFSGCPSDADVISKSKYDQISEGMSYSEVASIIGSEGAEESSSKIEGVPGVMESISTKMYAWQNSDGSNMNAIFQNDKLVQKAQFGLK